MKLDILAFDAETSVKCPVGNNKASPHWPENNIVTHAVSPSASLESKFDGEGILVAHNAPFDLQWLYRCSLEWYKTRGNLKLWDTGVAEYILSGQQAKWPSLDSLCTAYGRPVKDDKFKAHWESGGQTEDLPKDELRAYCQQDADNTAAIAEEQMMEAGRRGKLPLMRLHMDATLAITDMMYHGMKVDKVFLENACSKLSGDLSMLTSELRAEALRILAFTDPTNVDQYLDGFDLNSPHYLSKLLYGGRVSVTTKEVVGSYKNGRPKVRNVTKKVKVSGFGLTAPLGASSALATDDESLEWLHDKLLRTAPAIDKDIAAFIKQLQHYRKVYKDYSTYFSATNNLVMPDGCVHHSINNTATVTGRLSSSEPNLQNVTRGSGSDIKRAYVSRWGNRGYLVEADYKQLEIVALAALSGDKQLSQDIRDGVDIHTQLYKQMYGGATPTDDQRTEFKRLSFALIYGAGIKSMAKNAGVAEDIARKFSKTFENRYPDAFTFWMKVRDTVMTNRAVSTGRDEEDGGKPIAVGTYTTPTGRVLRFRDYKDKFKGGRTFSKSEMSNYPVQSFATGDCVPLGFGRLFRILTKDERLRDKCLLINTVHDSVLLDVHEDVLDIALPVIKDALENVPAYLKDVFDFDFNLPTKVDIKYGRNWKDLTGKYK